MTKRAKLTIQVIIPSLMATFIVMGVVGATTIGTNIDTGGTLTVTGNTTLGALTATGNITLDSGTIFVDATNNRVGIGTTTPTKLLSVGTTTGSQFLVDTSGVISDGVWQGTAIGPVYGGTGLTNFANNSLFYASADNVMAALAAGTDGQVLKMVSGTPQWSSDLTGGGSGAWATTTDGLMVYPVSDSYSLAIGANASSTAEIFLSPRSAESSWINSGNVGIGTTTPDTLFHVDGTSTFDEICFGTDCITDWAGAGLQAVGGETIGAPAVWVNANTITSSTTIQTAYGGTGRTTWDAGEIVFAPISGMLDTINKGSNNTVMYIDPSGNYAWTATTSWDTTLSDSDITALGYIKGMSSVTLGELADVSTTTLATGHVIYWDGTAWIDSATTSWDTTLSDSDIAGFGYVKGLSSVTLGELTDVSTSSLASGDLLYWDGTAWVRTASTTWDTDTNLTDLDISAFGYIKGLTLGEITDVATSTLASGDVLYWNGYDWITTATTTWGGGGGSMSLGAEYSTPQTGSTQYFSTSTAGSDFTISSVGNTHTWNLPSASASIRGLLTANDWTIFNSKWDELSDMSLADGNIFVGAGGDPAATTSLYIDDMGNVGVGTTTPQEELHVDGDIMIENGKLALDDHEGTYVAPSMSRLYPITAAGTDNYSAGLAGMTSYATGTMFMVTFPNGSTANSSLNINGLGAKDLFGVGDTQVTVNDIDDNTTHLMYYDPGINSGVGGFRVLSVQ